MSAAPRASTLHGALWARGRGPILVTVALGWLLSLGVRLVFPALLPSVRAAFDMSLTTAGLLITLLWVGYALAQLPGGILGDRIGERNILALSIGAATLTLVGVAAATGVPSFFAATVLYALGSGFYATTRFTVITDTYPEHTATAVGLTSAAGNLGATVLPVAGGLIAAVAGWRAGFGFAVPLLAITAVGLWIVVPVRTSDAGSAADALSRDTVRQVARAVGARPVLLGVASELLLSFIYNGFTGFLPTYLVAAKGLDPATAATVFGVFFGVGVVVQPLAGAVADRVGARRTLAGVAAGTAITLVALPGIQGLPALVAITALSSVQLGFWPVIHTYVIGALPAAVQGTGFGLIRSFYLLVAATGPVVVGALADAGWFDEAFLVLAGLAVVSAALCVALPAVDPVDAAR